jgi:hypothetical protein
MNFFNRVIVILGLLATMVLSAIIFVASGPVLRTLLVFLQRIENNISAMSAPQTLIRFGGGLLITMVIWALCAALLYLEFRRPKAKTIKVQKVSGGDAELTADSIASRLEYNIDLLENVVRAKPAISNARRGVKVVLEVETSPEVDVPTKTEEIQTLAKDIVENRMGLKLDSVKVVMRHTPYPKKGLFSGRKPESTPAVVEESPATAEGKPELAPPGEWLASPAEAVATEEDKPSDETGGTTAWPDEEEKAEN